MADGDLIDTHRVLVDGCPTCGYEPHPMPDTARRLRATLAAWQQNEHVTSGVATDPVILRAATRVRNACRTARAHLEAVLAGGDPELDGWDSPGPAESVEEGHEQLVAHEVATEMGATAHAFEVVGEDEWGREGHHGATGCSVEMLARHLLHEVEHLAHDVRESRAR